MVGVALDVSPFESTPSFELRRLFEEDSANGSVSPSLMEVLPCDNISNVEGEVSFSKALVVRPDDSPFFVSLILPYVIGEVVRGEVSGVLQDVNELALAPAPLVSSSKPKNSEWVLSMVTSFRHLVGVSSEGHEEELMTLFATLEMERNHSCSKTPSKSSSRCP